jgi:hypothetical protein
MSPIRTTGDRRAHVRLDVVGALWGTLRATNTAQVLDLSPTGALIVSQVPLAPDSVQSIRIALDGEEVTVEARVRHVREVTRPSQPVQYHVGLEFKSRLTIG